MKRAVLVMVLVGCGDDGAQPDAFIPQGPDYDLSCLDRTVTSVDPTLTLAGKLYDFASTMSPPATLADASITVYKVSDDSQVAMITSDADGKFTFDLPTGGSPTNVYYKVTGTGVVPSRSGSNLPPTMSIATGFLAATSQTRVDSLATALGTTNDASKGVLEVWAQDCSKGELPGATVQLDDAPAAAWAMWGGVGVWIPRATTLAHPNNANVGSVAGTMNVSPGVHNVTVTSGSLVMQAPVTVEAGTWNVILIAPGIRL